MKIEIFLKIKTLIYKRNNKRYNIKNKGVVSSMEKRFNEYLNKDHSFDKETMLGIFCLVIVITGIFGFLYEFIFYYFNGGMKEFYWRGGNFLPWINIYATGSIMIYLLTYKYRSYLSYNKVLLRMLLLVLILLYIFL